VAGQVVKQPPHDFLARAIPSGGETERDTERERGGEGGEEGGEPGAAACALSFRARIVLDTRSNRARLLALNCQINARIAECARWIRIVAPATISTTSIDSTGAFFARAKKLPIFAKGQSLFRTRTKDDVEPRAMQLDRDA